MALPLSGPLKLSDIRAELGMSGTTNFSLTNASIGNIGSYPVLNPFSPVLPNTLSQSPYQISDWYGYSSATIRWNNNSILGGPGRCRLQIYVNGLLRLDNTNTTNAGTSGTIVLNNGDTFYATMTPLLYSGFYGPNANLSIYIYASPFGLSNATSIDNTVGPSGTFLPFSSSTQTAIIQPINLAVYAIDTFL